MSDTPGSKSYLNPLIAPPAHPLPRRIAVIGAGTIGPDIAYYLASSLPGLRLYLVDIVQEALDRAVERIAGTAAKGVKKRKLSEDQATRIREAIVPTLSYADFADADWVLEAATERLDIKHDIFRRIEETVRPDAILTSNTSSLPAARLFAKLAHPERATVTHFFAPAYQNPAVEVIRWPKVDPRVVDGLRHLFCSTGKVPIVTADAICFLLDRVFDNWCNEAAYLLEHATAQEIDSVALDYVHAGPFQVLNLARGNPIIVETNTLQMEEGAHYRPAEIFRSVDTWRTLRPGERVKVEPAQAARVSDRLLGILFSQSVDSIDRGIATLADLNLGCTLALGFKEGPLDLMAARGEAETARILERLGEERPGMPQASKPLAEYQRFERHVLVDDVDGVKLLTLRRPAALNALDDRVTDEILAILRRHEGDPAVPGFVLIGYGGKAFSAGADVGRFPEVLGKADAAARYARDCSRLLVHLDRMGKPVVAALNGMALGGGFELALRCHARVAHRDAWFQFPEVTLGIAPGIGGMVVPYRLWPQHASVFHDMIRLARRLAATEARELGVVEDLADSYDGLVRLALERVHALAGKVPRVPDGPVRLAPLQAVEPVGPGKMPLSREVIALIEEAIRDSAAAPSFAEALEIGYQAFGRNACLAASREGVGAFLEKRKADFTKTG